LSPNTTVLGGALLAGGASRRMGSAKSALDVFGSSAVDRLSQVLARAGASPVLVVTAEGSPPAGMTAGRAWSPDVVGDLWPGQGPLAGIATGLSRLDGRCDAAYVVAVDTQLLRSATLRALASRLDDADVAVAVDDHGDQPLVAVYRTSLAPVARALVEAGARRPADLLDVCTVRRVAADELPGQAQAIANANTPQQWERLSSDGLPRCVLNGLPVRAGRAGDLGVHVRRDGRQLAPDEILEDGDVLEEVPDAGDVTASDSS
jgi:molybdenum cofactor guanylyltransferase